MNRKIATALMCLLACFIPPLAAQDSDALLSSYLRNFDKGDAAVKMEVIQDAVKRNNAALAPLFSHAVDFAVNKTERLKNESLIRLMSGICLEQVEKFKYAEARQPVWKLFLFDFDTNIRIKCLKALGVLAAGDKKIIEGINGWLADQIAAYKAGKKPELNVVLRSVMTLGELADESSFVVIFNTMLTGFNKETTNTARAILVQLKGDFKALILSIIRKGSIREKKEILVIALESASLNESDKGEIAAVSLDTALRGGSFNKEEIRELHDTRVLANRALSERKWKQAVKLVLQYFELVLSDYEKGLSGKPDLLEVIRSLGNMDSSEAAQKLAKYLDLLNTYTETKKVYDEQIVLETIDSLGRLGDKIAFDCLMNVRFLPYGATVKARAEDAIKSLKL